MYTWEITKRDSYFQKVGTLKQHFNIKTSHLLYKVLLFKTKNEYKTKKENVLIRSLHANHFNLPKYVAFYETKKYPKLQAIDLLIKLIH